MNSEKDSYGFDFNDKFEDIIAETRKKQDEYEDIVSDSGFKNGVIQYEDISSSSKNLNQNEKGFTAWWKRRHLATKIGIISVPSLFLTVIIAVLLIVFVLPQDLFYNYNHINENNLGLPEGGKKDENIINVALFGVDTRDENVFTGNTDSIMILSLNTDTKKVKIFSVMRDSFVPMEYQGKSYYGKINSAYSKGPEHAIKTLNTVFNLDISEYATVNFYGMTDIIDAVGGIPATITPDELTWKGANKPNLNNCMDEICREMGLNPKDYYIHTPGEQTLNGVQAVAYARVRHCRSTWGTNNDYGRTDRQRHVMQGLFNKATKMGTGQYISLAKSLIPCSETSLSYTDIIELAMDILLDSPTFEQYRIPQSEFTMNFTGPSKYGSVVYYDIDFVADMINSMIYEDITMEQYLETHEIEKNDWYHEMAGWSEGTGSSTNNSSSNTSQTDGSSEPNQSDVSSDDITSSEDDTSSEDGTSSEDDTTDEDGTSSEDGTTSEDQPPDDGSSEDGDNTSSGDDGSSDDSSEDNSSENNAGNSSTDDGTTPPVTSENPEENPDTPVVSQPGVEIKNPV